MLQLTKIHLRIKFGRKCTGSEEASSEILKEMVKILKLYQWTQKSENFLNRIK